MLRPFNFSAGPSALPLPVLERAAREMCNWPDENGKLTGMGVMEMSHRGKEFISIYQNAIRNLRKLLSIPEHFSILFLQGGGSLQNAAIPLNLCPSPEDTAAFVVTGAWSKKSYFEAKKYCQAALAADSFENNSYITIPDASTWRIPDQAKFIHICANETIHGVEFTSIPDLKRLGSHAELVMDCSSNLASCAIPWDRVGLVYAGAQKNLGPAGLTIVIVRDDLINSAQVICPSVLNYQLQKVNDSMLNTPPTYAIYMAGLMFEWMLGEGGLSEMRWRAQLRSRKLYEAIDKSPLFLNQVDAAFRSHMNAPFFLKETRLYPQFLQDAEVHGLLGLKGHKSVGGLRASMYNALSVEAVDHLLSLMQAFEMQHVCSQHF